jgi:hypothetical protein
MSRGKAGEKFGESLGKLGAGLNVDLSLGRERFWKCLKFIKCAKVPKVQESFHSAFYGTGSIRQL